MAVDGVRQPVDRLPVVLVGRAAGRQQLGQHVGQHERRADLDEGPAAEGHPVLEGEPDGHDDQVLDALRDAPRAMRAAPVFIGARRDRALVVPSGKMAMVPPLARTSWQAANAEVLPAEASRWSTAWSCVR